MRLTAPAGDSARALRVLKLRVLATISELTLVSDTPPEQRMVFARNLAFASAMLVDEELPPDLHATLGQVVDHPAVTPDCRTYAAEAKALASSDAVVRYAMNCLLATTEVMSSDDLTRVVSGHLTSFVTKARWDFASLDRFLTAHNECRTQSYQRAWNFLRAAVTHRLNNAQAIAMESAHG